MSTTDISESDNKNQFVDLNKLIWVGPLSVAAATLANVFFYYFVTRVLQIRLYAPEQFPPPQLSPIPVTDVVIFSLIFSGGAVIIYWLIVRYRIRPLKTYIIVCLVVLVLSLLLPLKIPTPPVPISTKWSLMTMHVIGGIVVVGVLVSMNLRQRK